MFSFFFLYRSPVRIRENEYVRTNTVVLWPITELVVTNQRTLLRYYGNDISCAGCGLERKTVLNQAVITQFFIGQGL